MSCPSASAIRPTYVAVHPTSLVPSGRKTGGRKTKDRSELKYHFLWEIGRESRERNERTNAARSTFRPSYLSTFSPHSAFSSAAFPRHAPPSLRSADLSFLLLVCVCVSLSLSRSCSHSGFLLPLSVSLSLSLRPTLQSFYACPT